MTPSTTPPKHHDACRRATSNPASTKLLALPKPQQKGSHGGQRGEGGGQAGQAGQAAQDARPRADPHAPRQDVGRRGGERLPLPMRGLAERGTSRGAVHAVDARRPAQEEYAQGEYGDEISWFSDSGLVEKVQNRQGLFMYFKRFVLGVRGTSSSMAAGRLGGVTVDGRRDGVEAPRAVTRRAQAPRVPRQVPAARQDLRVRERRRPQVGPRRDAIDFRTHERKTKTSFRSSYW